MSVIHQRPVYAVTAGEGDGPDADTIAAELGGTPNLSYATTAQGGVASSFIRTDDQLEFPNGIMPTTSTRNLTIIDGSSLDVNGISLVSSVKDFTIGTSVAEGRISVNPSGGSTNAFLVKAQAGIGGQSDVIQSTIDPIDINNQTVDAYILSCNWNKQLVTASVIGYNMGTFTFAPTAGSDTNNTVYGAKFSGPFISNATGGYTEVAALSLTAPRRLIKDPTVNAAYTQVLDCPSVSSTIQVGVYIKQRTAQTAATDRYGILCDGQNSGTNRYGAKFGGNTTGTPTNSYGVYSDSHSVGTNRWSFWGSNKFHCDASDFIANASSFGFCNRDSQSSSAGGGGTARYWRMFTDASATGVSGDVTIAIDSAGNMTATRAGGAAGTVLLKLVDVGTAAVTT